jgi:tudor domain-containing protein 3
MQLIKLRNIGAPKEHETSQTAPQIFKLALTDGNSNCNCLVLDNVQKLNLNTPPGTKILLKGLIKIKSGLLLIDSRNMSILGGNVEHLVTKWKTARVKNQSQNLIKF